MGADAAVLELDSTVTDAEGRFTFLGVTRSAEIMLHWWRRGVTTGMAESINRLDDAAATSIEIKLPAPARIVATVDRSKHPQVGGVLVTTATPPGHWEKVESKSKEQALFEFDDLAAGEYSVNLQGPTEPLPGGPFGAFTQKNLASKNIAVHPGETLRVEFP